MGIKQRLTRAIFEVGGIPPLEADTIALCRDALAEIERLERAKHDPLCIRITRKILREEVARLERVLEHDYSLAPDQWDV